MKTIERHENQTLTPVANGVSRKILAYGNEVMGVEVHFETGGIGTVHTHVHAQFTYVLEGKFEFIIENETLLVSKGDTLYFKPNQSHGVTCLEKGILLDVFTPLRDDFLK